MAVEPTAIQAHQLAPQHIIFGNLRPFVSNTLGFLEDAGAVSSFTRFRLLETPVYLVTNADLVHEVLTNKSQSYVRNRSFARRLRRLFGHGLLTSEGEQWKQLRKLTAPAFQPKSTNSYIPIILDEIDTLMTEWQGQQQVDIGKQMSRITARIITRCIFGMHLNVDLEEMECCMTELMGSLAPRLRFPIYTPDWLPVGGNPAYRKAVQRLDALIYSGISQHIEDQREQGSLLHDLAAASREQGLINPSHLRDQIVTLFLAGHETTATTLAFCFILLSQHPEYAQRLQQETTSVDLRALTNLTEIRHNLPFTYNVIRETMRLYPAGYVFGRTVVKPTQLGGESIKPNSLILISPYVIHRNPDLYPQPARFNPDRWSGLELNRTQYLPFSAGARTCIGEHLAMLEACLLLAGISARYQISCGTDPIHIQTGITLRPTNNCAATLQPIATN
ncbi:MAG: cytochrome P450 [Ketobacter sp.]